MIAMKAISPVKFRAGAFNDELFKALLETRDGFASDFDKTAATWKKKPEFEKEQSNGYSVMSAGYWTANEIYGYLTHGTKGPYPIPKPGNTSAKTLRFQWGGPGSYSAKTSPRRISSTTGGPSGPMVFRKRVMHPGIKAREFDETIAEKWTPEFARRMKNAMARATRKSGHGA